MKSGRELSALAVHHAVPWIVFRVWPVSRLAAIAFPRTLPSHQSEQLFLLRADGDACPTRAWRARRVNACGSQTESVDPAKKHAGCDLALLAFYGCALGVSASVVVDEALASSSRRRYREPRRFNDRRTSSGPDRRTRIFGSGKKIGDVAVYHRRLAPYTRHRWRNRSDCGRDPLSRRPLQGR